MADMTLRQLLEHLQNPDLVPEVITAGVLHTLDVEFFIERDGEPLTLLSVYYTDGKIAVDLGPCDDD